MFNFKIITTADGNQIIDRNLKTPYSSLTPVQMVEYTEMEQTCIYGQNGTKSETESGAYAESCKESILQNGLYGWVDIREREVKQNDNIKIFQYGTGSNYKINQ